MKSSVHRERPRRTGEPVKMFHAFGCDEGYLKPNVKGVGQGCPTHMDALPARGSQYRANKFPGCSRRGRTAPSRLGHAAPRSPASKIAAQSAQSEEVLRTVVPDL